MKSSPALHQLILYSQFTRVGNVEGEDKVLVTIGGRVLKVSEPTCLVMEGLAAGHSAEGIAVSVNEARVLPYTVNKDLISKIAAQLQPVFMSGTLTNTRASKIWAQSSLLTFARMRPLLDKASNLFSNQTFFFVSFIALALANATYAIQTTHAVKLVDLAWYSMPSLVLCMFLLTLGHEIGHAAAAYRFGVTPKKIGVGMFLFVPVLYTDVTEIWRLEPKKRVVVNLAGVYVQLLLNLPILLAAAFITVPALASFLHVLAFISILATFFNLIPYTRLDGYWVAVDLLGITNLQTESGRVQRDLWRRFFGCPVERMQVSWPLICYAFGSLLFMAALIGLIVLFVWRLVVDLAAQDWAADSWWQVISSHPLRFALLVFLVFALFKHALRLIQKSMTAR